MKKVARFFVIPLLMALLAALPIHADENVAVVSDPVPVETVLARPVSDTGDAGTVPAGAAAAETVAEDLVAAGAASEPEIEPPAVRAPAEGVVASEDVPAGAMPEAIPAAEQIEKVMHPEPVVPQEEETASVTDGSKSIAADGAAGLEGTLEVATEEDDGAEPGGTAVSDAEPEAVQPAEEEPVFGVQIEEAVTAEQAGDAADIPSDVLPTEEITGDLPGSGEGLPLTTEVTIISSEPVTEPVQTAKPVKKKAVKKDKTGTTKKLTGVKGVGSKDGTVFKVEQPKPMVKSQGSSGVELPEGVQKVVDKAGEWLDNFDDATLEHVNKQLSVVGLEADSAELRPSGGGVGLEVSIKLHKDKEEKKKLSEAEQKLEKRKKVYSTMASSSDNKDGKK